MEESSSTNSSPDKKTIPRNAEQTPPKKNEEQEFVKVSVDFGSSNTTWYTGGKKLLARVVKEENALSEGVTSESNENNGKCSDRGLEKNKPSGGSGCNTDHSSEFGSSNASLSHMPVSTFHPNYEALLLDAIQERPSPSHTNTSKAKKRNQDDKFENPEKNEKKKTKKPVEKSDCGFEDLTNLQKGGSSMSTEEPQETNRHTDALALLADRTHELHSSSDNESTLKSNENNKDEMFEDLSESVQKLDDNEQK
ncbi:hypothetical protein CAEBREN_23391 [Caenorhabditis brenneri]|uniref:Uncharacterized protein n=1 Tax=Caenorhabditis brenneri TaxID=135651 RepID=G0NEV0_CAEBE|nr:hypothetical protein CAEBREN_23391 [Caenorhabditis brenneri]